MTSERTGIKFLGFETENTEKLAEKDFPMKFISAEQTKVGDDEYCRGWKIHSPGNFHVIKSRDWNDLEKYQELFTAFYEGKAHGVVRKNLHRLRVTWGPDLVGLFVAAKHLEGQWYRARVLSCYLKDGKERLDVQLLDYGEVVRISPKMVRRIPEAILKRVSALAIQCTINVGDAFPEDHVWTNRQTKIFFEMMKECRYRIKFVEKTNSPPESLLWKCQVHIVKYESGHDMETRFSTTETVSVNQRFVEALREASWSSDEELDFSKEPFMQELNADMEAFIRHLEDPSPLDSD